ncbi:hypothetical protein FXB79_11375 [Aggregatibacter actinomycetemcomitans]|uniref:Uncharacterized protein n=1 Tax=Aggregatibacter actinomycetemcomitans TaxID=714 RepID=A0AB74N379_AGGAC|nr:hypothetical protein FXB79_11375 [Aggregatibacter actinomycetemcomitans]TYA44123.1 hypothetical protein FV644_11465 [Aggregatibacter actinomycetemcomitans]TYB05446.1 hypothetical protein FXE07_11430 [Aggregatibacter actinomycetemcomitans]
MLNFGNAVTSDVAGLVALDGEVFILAYGFRSVVADVNGFIPADLLCTVMADLAGFIVFDDMV